MNKFCENKKEKPPNFVIIDLTKLSPNWGDFHAERQKYAIKHLFRIIQ